MNWYLSHKPSWNADNILNFLLLQLPAESETVCAHNTIITEPTGELLDLMSRVGAIAEVGQEEGININLLTFPYNNFSTLLKYKIKFFTF